MTGYRPELDGLRAIAVAGVIAHHAGVDLPGGFAGVDVFFVLSGFLVTGLLLAARDKGGIQLGHFLARRARRILPALVLVLAVSTVLALALAPPDALVRFSHTLIAIVLMGANIELWQASGYFAPTAATLPLLHTWSLSVEEQFYLVWPVTIILAARFRVPLALIVALGVVGSLCLAEWAARIAPSAAFYLTPFRAWELLAGAGAALVVHHVPPLLRRNAREALTVVGIVLIGGTFALLQPDMGVPGLVLLAPVAGTVLVVLFAHDTRTGAALSCAPLVGLGLISYSAYLWHQPLFAFARLAHFEALPPAATAGLVLLTLILATLTYHFVENPFRRGAMARAKPVPTLAVSALALMLVASAGLVGTRFDGFAVRFGAERLAVLDSAVPSPRRAACHGPAHRAPAAEAVCRYGEGHVTTAVWGDSHAVEFAYAFAEHLAARGEALLHLSASGCAPALGFETPVRGCRAFSEGAVAYIAASNVETVVIAFRHAVYLKGDNADTFPHLPDTVVRLGRGAPQDLRRRYWESLKSAVQQLRAAGKHVILLEPVPEIGRRLDHWVFVRGVKDGQMATVSRAYYEARTADIRMKLAALAPTIPVTGALCSADTCYGALEGKALYFDDDHLSVAGARRVVRNHLDTRQPPILVAPAASQTTAMVE